MKTALILLLLPFNTFAASYSCAVKFVRFELEITQHSLMLLTKDAQTGEFIYSGFGLESASGERTELTFDELTFTFKTADLNKESDRLFGLVRGNFGRGYVDQSLACFKKK